jgi:hypothetical protein
MYKNRKFSELVFLYLINISFVLYIIVLLGVGGFAPKYFHYLKTFLQIYIGILLVIRYNPITYKGRDFGEFDRQLVFSSGIFLLLSTALIGSIQKYLQNKTTALISTGISSIANIATTATTATNATIYK